MKVAIDARTLQARPLGGVGRALAATLPELAAHVDVDLLTDARIRPALASSHVYPLRAPGSSRGVAWLQLAAPRWLEGYRGVFHCPFYGLPVRQPVPMVVTMYDITFETNPEWFSRAAGLVLRSQARVAARTARRIVTGSDHVRRAIVERYDVDADRVVVAPLTVEPAFLEPAPDPPARLVGRRYVIALGGAPRRQLEVAVAAWRRVRTSHPELELAVVGSERLHPEAGLVQLGTLDDADWRGALAGAVALCYPTLDEGFGMPAAEAAASGTPVVCAPLGSLPEVLGDAAAWAGAATVDAVADALARLLGDEERRLRLADAGTARVRSLPGWAASAAVLGEAYEAAAGA